MNKRLVVLLGEDPASTAALRLGLRRAAHYDGVLVGVAVVNVKRIEEMIGGAPAGAIHFAEKAREKLLSEAQRRVETLAGAFVAACREPQVRHEVYIKSGNEADELEEETRTADLLLVGLSKGGENGGASELLLRDLLKAPLCPVIAVAADEQLPERVIIAYDGSPHAARALKAFAQLSGGLALTKRAVLLHVGEDSEAGMAMLAKAEAYLNLYGFQVTKMVRSGSPQEVIFRLAKEKPLAGVVLGAYGHSGFSEFFFGSTARLLVRDGSIPLFLYH
jgi:nucleotide-binding universal stress UspA family protein